jgi:hypothetical protein
VALVVVASMVLFLRPDAAVRTDHVQDFQQLLAQEKTTSAKMEALHLQLDGTNDEQIYEEMSDILGKQAAAYLDQSKYKEAETVFKEAENLSRKALELRHRKLGAEHPEVTRSTRNLADMLGNHSENLRRVGKLDDAARLKSRAELIRANMKISGGS